MKNALMVLIVACAIMLPVAALADSECISTYTWKCEDKAGNNCVGGFSPETGYVYTEDESVLDLWYVLRFENLPPGAHKLRVGGNAQYYSNPGDTDEVFNFWKKQRNGCDGDDAFYQWVADFTVDGPVTVTDYALGYSGTTDICIGAASSDENSDRDEFLISMEYAGLYAPVIVTTVPATTEPVTSDFTTGPGSIAAGDHTDTESSNDAWEVFTEGGSQHQLWHVWKFLDVPSGTSHRLVVEGYRPSNSDDDDFNLLYKWSSTCTGVFQQTGLTINMESGDEQAMSTTIGPGSNSGTLCIAIDDSAGGSANDTVLIDHLYVVTECAW